MTADSWIRVRKLCQIAVGLPGEEREKFLRENTASPEERAAVERLLQNQEAPTALDLEPGRNWTADTAGSELPFAKLSHYKLLDRLGEGGMGTVYLAVDERLHRQVAIKLLRPDQSSRPERRSRFYKEAQAASALNHPNIITIYEIDSDQGIDYIAMEYVAGKTVRTLIAESPLDLKKTLRYAIQIADALSVAHAAGIVHRDLKPANVMVTERGLVKVLDFGLAKLTETFGEDPETIHKTVEGTILGTISYMSPEQGQGKPVDARSDIFSFGALLYEMITGRLAFPGDNPLAILSAILNAQPQRLRDVIPEAPAALDEIVAGCLHKDVAGRTQTMDQVKLALEDLAPQLALSGSVSAIERLAREPASVARPPRLSLRRYWAAALAVLFAGAVGYAVWSRGAKRATAPDEIVLSRLTSDAGLTAFPAISEDGRMVAYASDRARSGNLDIWVQQVGGDAIRLTSHEADEYDPEFSPDGTKILYRSERDGGGVYMGSTMGGEPRLVTAGGYNPHFSPDGSSILYWSGREGSFIPGSASMYVIPVQGGQPRRIEVDMGAALYPIWVPDGQHILFAGKGGHGQGQRLPVDWYIAAVSGGPAYTIGAAAAFRERKMSDPLWRYFPVPICFVPDGEQVIFTALSGDSTNLWELPVSLANRRVAGEPRRLTSGTGLETHPSFSGDAKRRTFVYSSLAVNADIWSLPIEEETGRVLGEPDRVTQELSHEVFPSLSADGKKVAFNSSRPGSWQVVVRDLETGKDAVLANSTYRWLQPKLGPDGTRVAYWDLDAQLKTYTVKMVSTSGGAAQTICADCGPATDFSPDGGKVLFEPIKGRGSVMMADTKTGEKIEMVPAPDDNHLLFGGRFSPDGRWIAFHASVDIALKRRIFLAPVQNGRGLGKEHWISISDGNSEDTEASWSPGGNVLYFLSDRDRFRCVWARRLHPRSGQPQGEPFPVLHFHHAKRSLKHGVNRYGAVGVGVARGRMVLAFGDLTGNVWMSAAAVQ